MITSSEDPEQLKISEKTSEYLLYLFKMNNMVAESVDLCQNYHKVVKGFSSLEQAKRDAHIRNYYMSDALLQVPLGQAEGSKHYYDLLGKAVFAEQEDGNESVAYLTSMTKAYFKDGSVDHALKYFEDGIRQRAQAVSEQEEMLVKMFDSSFGLDSGDGSKLDMQTFVARYYNLMATRQKLKKEAKLVKMLDSILARCEPEEVDHVFSLQAVLREERQILAKIIEMSAEDYSYVDGAFQDLPSNYREIFKFVSSLVRKDTVQQTRKYARPPVKVADIDGVE